VRPNGFKNLPFCGIWLACDAGTSIFQVHPVDAIAGKPAPTQKPFSQLDRVEFSTALFFSEVQAGPLRRPAPFWSTAP
ncbi:MAG: hypothetical protein WBB95_11895, partial [Pseudomonas sp.]